MEMINRIDPYLFHKPALKLLAALCVFFGVMALMPNPAFGQQSAVSPQLEWWLDQHASRNSDARLPRCFTMFTAEHARGETDFGAGFESLFMKAPQMQSDNSYQSPGGEFLIWYDLSGEHAVPPGDDSGTGIPDWVEMIAAAADSSRAFYMDSLGYVDPVQGASPYNIYLRNLGFYGFTGIEQGELFSVVDSRFDWIPGNDAEDEAAGAARATTAHEVFHAIQHAYNEWQGPTGATAWLEMDAVTAENQVFPDVKEYLNFIGDNSIFRLPGQSTPVPYDHATWLMFFTEAVAPDFMRHLWERISLEPEISMEQAIAAELNQRGLDYDETIVKLHLWHLASGNWSQPGFGFADADRYPTSFKRAQRNTMPTSPFALATIAKNAAGYYAIDPTEPLTGNMLSAFFGEMPQTGWGLVAYFQDGSVETVIPNTASGHTPVLFTADFNWDELDRLGVAVTNSNPEASAIHQLLIGNEDTIEQIKYGDANSDGVIKENDAQRVLDEVTGASEVRLGLARSFAGDVSGDGELSAYDAGLIFRRSSGFSSTFPADINQSGFGPDLPLFGLDRPQPPLNPVTPESLPDIQLTFSAESLYRGDEATIDLSVSGLPEAVLSVELVIYYDDSLISFREINSSASGFNEIIQSSAKRDALSTSIAWASNQSTGDGIIGTLVFDLLDEGVAELVVAHARINETEANYQLPTVSFETDPNDPVSTDPGQLTDAEVPHSPSLKPAYPNPFNPTTRIPFELSEQAEVDLHVYDLTGRLAATIVQERTFAPGLHTLEWDAIGFATGIYIIVFQSRSQASGTTRQTMKVSLIR